MLERVEILEGGRKELRRDVRLACEISSELWDEEVAHRLVDLSPSGGFIETTFPLGPGDEIEVRFNPPKSRAEYLLRARVVRTSLGRRCAKRDLPGMGVEFLEMTKGDRAGLAAQLVGIPPRIPLTRSRKAKQKPKRSGASLRVVAQELVWIEELLVDETTKLGNGVSESIRSALDELDPRAIAALLY